jgi:hypothetical protein
MVAPDGLRASRQANLVRSDAGVIISVSRGLSVEDPTFAIYTSAIRASFTFERAHACRVLDGQMGAETNGGL